MPKMQLFTSVEKAMEGFSLNEQAIFLPILIDFGLGYVPGLNFVAACLQNRKQEQVSVAWR
jgi:hypothetical protein